jgi:hypothetical protein
MNIPVQIVNTEKRIKEIEFEISEVKKKFFSKNRSFKLKLSLRELENTQFNQIITYLLSV